MTVLFLLGHFLLAAVLMALANRIGMIPWRRATEAHWTERARLLWPVRVTAIFNLFLLPILLINVHHVLFPESLDWSVSEAIAGFLGALLGCYPTDREVFPQLGFRPWLYQVTVTWGIRAAYFAGFLTACYLMPHHFNGKAIGVALAFLGFHGAYQFGLPWRLLRVFGVLVPAGEALRSWVLPLADARGIRVRAIWEIKGPMVLAFALPFTRELAFSQRLVEVCDPGAITAIGAHELAHLSESRMVLSGRFLASLSWFPVIFLSPLIHAFQFWGILMGYGAALCIGVLSRKLTHRMERRADRLATHEQPVGDVYARALETLYRVNLIPAVNVNDRQTHPHLYDRMLAAGVTPDYPRPKKPSRLTLPGWICFGLLTGTFVLRWVGDAL